ncbi:hypothetical protein GA0070621_1641 [Micromonospora narathiwatensis]|uniref:Uncharacterized protein n=1 Tax=Micromonospora narathiwatensis TaxID=299146 RepID=A0A1A8ZGD8_9ACTN|nr:hypothetical protein GA0070621_1641 [Micromonospora narathiwatensis]
MENDPGSSIRLRITKLIRDAHQDERAAAERTARPEPPDERPEPSVREQLARLHAMLDDLERQLPELRSDGLDGPAPARGRVASR